MGKNILTILHWHFFLKSKPVWCFQNNVIRVLGVDSAILLLVGVGLANVLYSLGVRYNPVLSLWGEGDYPPWTTTWCIIIRLSRQWTTLVVLTRVCGYRDICRHICTFIAYGITISKDVEKKVFWGYAKYVYSKTCLKCQIKMKTKNWFSKTITAYNAGHKYCRRLLESS